MLTSWLSCLSSAMITRWHYYIDTVMITRWRYCLNAVMITRWQYCLSAAIITIWHYCISVEMFTGWVHWINNFGLQEETSTSPNRAIPLIRKTGWGTTERESDRWTERERKRAELQAKGVAIWADEHHWIVHCVRSAEWSHEAHFSCIYVCHNNVFEADSIYKKPPPNDISPKKNWYFYFALGLHPWLCWLLERSQTQAARDSFKRVHGGRKVGWRRPGAPSQKNTGCAGGMVTFEARSKTISIFSSRSVSPWMSSLFCRAVWLLGGDDVETQ